MKLIATLNLDGNGRPQKFISTEERRAARGVLRNDVGHVAFMRFETTGVCKLPGGGIDPGEATLDALHREIREETGYEITDIQELGMLDEYRQDVGFHQESYCYTARVTKFVGTDLTEKEHAKGMVLQWCNTIDGAIKAIQYGQAHAETDEDGSSTGLEIMARRDTAILKAAKNT